MKFFVRASALLSMLLLSGCSDVWCWPFDCSSSKSSSGVVDDSTNGTDEDPYDNQIGGGSGTSEFDLSKVTWLHTDVSSWPVTSTLSISIKNGTMCLNFSGTSTWPTAKILHTNGTRYIQVNANPWVFVSQAGKWYGGTWEWMKPNGNCKPIRKIEGGHIKQAPLKNWEPRSGDKLYFMVSSIARGANLNNYKARTNVVEVTWP